MKILAMEKEVPGVAGEDLRPFLRAGAAKAWELCQAGTIREIYFRRDQNTAVLILECEDVADAKQVLGTLPLVKQGLIEFEIIPLAPYPGFKRLFGDL